MKLLLSIFCFYIFLVICKCECINGVCDNSVNKKYDPTWESLDARPLPEWYDNAKVGIFIHWGVYSVPSFGTEWFWINWKTNVQSYVDFMTKNYKPGFTYQDFAKDFNAELFNATQWALLFKDSGAKYVVLTSKHHDGYALWPSSYSFSWNAQDIGPHRDIIGELSQSIRSLTDLKFGLYYSLFEWFNRMYLSDKKHIWAKSNYVDKKVLPELKEIVEQYKPEVIWSDGDWEAPSMYWKAREFIAWLYNESPVRDTVVTNDRWGVGITCHHGDFYTCTDRYNPGILQTHKWENAMTIDRGSWGHRSNIQLKDYLTSQELIDELVSTVSCGGNILVNVGPNKYGTIEAIFEERLRDMGDWLKLNGEAIYFTKPWIYQNDTMSKNVWYTAADDKQNSDRINVYAIVLRYPYDTKIVKLHGFSDIQEKNVKVTLMGADYETKWYIEKDTLVIIFPPINILDRFKLKFAWTFRINTVKPQIEGHPQNSSQSDI